MLLVFLEDGTLDIVSDLAEAQRNYEGVDVESGVCAFYDETGVYLEPRFTVPNKYGKFLWIFDWCSSGVYELIPNPRTTEDPLWLALFETSSLSPNKYFKTMDEVKTYLKSKGAVVDKPTEP